MSYRMIHLRNLVCALFPWLFTWLERLRFAFVFLPRFAKDGLSLPLPYLLKRAILARAAARCSAEMLVETGTYMGDTPWHFRHRFKRIWTVEVHPVLAGLAKRRFAAHPQVTVVEGDSRHVLKDIVSQVDRTVIYWLDGHYSGGITGIGEAVCPIFAELETIFSQAKTAFLICIDDARLFGTEDGYPTIPELTAFLQERCGTPRLWIENDIIFIVRAAHEPSGTRPFPGFDHASFLY
jgi:hypothetical protein